MLFLIPLVAGELQAEIISTTGDVVVHPGPAPSDKGILENDSLIAAFNLEQDVWLGSSTAGIPANSLVSYHLFHFDPLGDDSELHRASGTASFDQDVLAIRPAAKLESPDSYELLPDGKSVSVSFRANFSHDQVEVTTGITLTHLTPLENVDIVRPPVKAIGYREYELTWQHDGIVSIEDLEVHADLSSILDLLTGHGVHKDYPIATKLDLPIQAERSVSFAVPEDSPANRYFGALSGKSIEWVEQDIHFGVSLGGIVGMFAEVQPGDTHTNLSVDAGADLGIAFAADMETVSGLPEGRLIDSLFEKLPQEVKELSKEVELRGSVPIGEIPGIYGGFTAPLPDEVRPWAEEASKRVGAGVRLEASGYVNLDERQTLAFQEINGPSTGASLSELLEGSRLAISGKPHITSETGSVTLGASSVTLETGSPVWVVSLVLLKSPSNALTFDAEFVGQSAAEAYLTVWWDGEQVGTIDERVEPDGINTYLLLLGDENLELGPYELGFRLDSYSDVASAIEITNLSTLSIVPEPAGLLLLSFGAGVVLPIQRRSVASS